ncbi:unnamed protein product [Closterium sp. NIES-54]
MAGSSPGIGASLPQVATVLSILLLLALAALVNPAVQGATGGHVIRNQVFRSQVATAPSSLRRSPGPPSSISVTAKLTATVAATATAGTVQSSRQLRRPAAFRDGAARVLWSKRVLASAQRKTSSPFTYKVRPPAQDTRALLNTPPVLCLSFPPRTLSPHPARALSLPRRTVQYSAVRDSPCVILSSPFAIANHQIDIQGFGRFTGFGIKSPVMQVGTTCYVMYVLKGGKIISQKCNSPDYGLG